MSGSSDPYVYPGSAVLRNRFGITDGTTLAKVERELVTQRIEEGAPGGGFDLPHLQAIHRHLFQDVYVWAGELRTIELTKGGNPFIHRRFIANGIGDVYRRLQTQDHLRRLSRANFAIAAAQVVGDINYVHPFREGNGRAQLEYLRQLTAQAGHTLDPAGIDPTRWIVASIASHGGDYEPMQREILASIGYGQR